MIQPPLEIVYSCLDLQLLQYVYTLDIYSDYLSVVSSGSVVFHNLQNKNPARMKILSLHIENAKIKSSISVTDLFCKTVRFVFQWLSGG